MKWTPLMTDGFALGNKNVTGKCGINPQIVIADPWPSNRIAVGDRESLGLSPLRGGMGGQQKEECEAHKESFHERNPVKPTAKSFKNAKTNPLITKEFADREGAAISRLIFTSCNSHSLD
jgi:hypothetical protein